MAKKRNNTKENIWNVPNTLTFIRVLLTLLTIYFIFSGFSIITIIVTFSIAAITDFLDGQIARRFRLATKFGRKFDILADRFLMLGVVGAIMIDFAINKMLTSWYSIQILLIMSREIISFPFAVLSYSSTKPMVPHARFVGKLMTLLQGFAFPLILLNMAYPAHQFSIYLAIPTFIVGIVSGLTYVKDLQKAGVKG